MKSLFFILFVIFITSSSASPTTANSYFWFPNPREEGQLIKAFLNGDPGPGYNYGSVDDIHYYLYTKDNPLDPHEIIVGDEASLEESHYDKAAPVKFVAHGFSSSYTDGCMRSVKDGYLSRTEPYNVIIIEWSVLAVDPWYQYASNNTILVGERTAELIEFMIETGYTKLEDVHVMGYSLGGHVAGNTGHAMKTGKIARITAFDPALPLFEIATDDYRVDPTDAVFVDVIHSGAGFLIEGGLGFHEPRGHVDYYPNSGRRQPGCEGETFSSCSHGRACAYFAESLRATTIETQLTACRCSTWDGFVNEECVCKIKVPMGAFIDVNTTPGKYYLHTNAKSPYARGDDMSPPPKL